MDSSAANRFRRGMGQSLRRHGRGRIHFRGAFFNPGFEVVDFVRLFADPATLFFNTGEDFTFAFTQNCWQMESLSQVAPRALHEARPCEMNKWLTWHQFFLSNNPHFLPFHSQNQVRSQLEIMGVIHKIIEIIKVVKKV